MTENKKLKVVFAPGSFDNFDGTQEELDEMLAEIHRLVDTGELFERATALTEDSFDELDEEIKVKLIEAMDSIEDEDFDKSSARKLH